MEYKHFSHPHNLKLYQVQQGQQLRCWGCHSPCQDSVYACWSCNFFLHEHCGNATRYVKHPYHRLHPLILVPRPTYTSGSFLCNACAAAGTSFSYCCAMCEVDLHVPCSFLPPTVNHPAHQHELSLSHVEFPATEASPTSNCKLCHQLLQSRQWSYSCRKCDFSAHTFCATREVKPGLYQDDDDDGDVPEPDSNGAGSSSEAPAGDAVAELLKLQLEMEMAAHLAQMMAACKVNFKI
ncbi:uncharacterized protein LOC127789051 [Diospyros lotus]|uniref:uncharacterized protein LOC127789051 n=1 Tax=Diospyros lotus TaxID=55363 RepID=UPI00225999E7|nr:uncharacterized protein LOC127789051 [Diospyros lotus]